MKWRGGAVAGGALGLLLVPGGAQAHAAFGNLGPFYGGLLHPIADPAQGLILVALAVLLARQPAARARTGFAALMIFAVAALLAHMRVPGPETGLRVLGAVMALLGGLALWGAVLPLAITAGLAGLVGLAAGFAGDVVEAGPRAALLAAGGAALGIGLVVLLCWAAMDLLQSRLGRLAGAVAGSWVAATGLMTAALPAVPY